MVRTRSILSLSSRRFDSRCSSDQSSGIGVIAKNAFWPLSSGPGDDSIAPPNERRKTGVHWMIERIVGQPDQVALATERLDPGVLSTAEVEQVVRLRVLGGDRVEDAAHERLLIVGQRLIGSPRRPELGGDPNHLGPDRAELALSGGDQTVGGQVVGPHRVTHLLGE